MTLAAPKLDDRRFQDLVDEAKKRIPHYCNEWTDHNVSDPGVTLIELFAWMTEVLLYRLNQVPDLHYVRFLEMLGIHLKEPCPASAPVTFWLSTPVGSGELQSTPVTIPAQTEVASTQTETERSIVFSTDADLVVQPPMLDLLLTRVSASRSDATKKSIREHNLRRLEAGVEGFDVFSSPPQVNDALYFGFANNLSHHVLGLDLGFDPAGGAGVDPTLPPYIWEASTGEKEQHWMACDVEEDSTRGMNTAGRIQLHLPEMGLYSVNHQERYWLRARLREISPAEDKAGVKPYDSSPRLRKVRVAAWGGSVPAKHSQVVRAEHLGSSDGSPGQRFYLQFRPIIARQPEEQLVVHVEGEPPQVWQEVTDFAGSGAGDRHYTLDSQSGEVRFGPAVRQPDGTIKLYGAIPPRGSQLVFTCYRFGGGQQGNLQRGVLNTLKTSIPFVARVSNRAPAWGGLDGESLEAAKMRAPAMLRTRERAVTEEDFEFLARQALPAQIGRVKCLQPRPAEAGKVIPGQVFVLVIPRAHQPDGYLSPDQLELNDEQVNALAEYLEERRLLTTRVEIRSPAFYWVSVNVQLRASAGVAQDRVESEILQRLYRTLNPLTGGLDGVGWPFGRDLFVSDVYQCLQGTPHVQFIRAVQMYAADPGGVPQGSPVEEIEIVAHGVVASGRHTVEFI